MSDKKVILRPLEEQDTANILRWRNADEVRRNLFTQTLLTEEQHLRYFRSMVQSGRCRQYIITEVGPESIDIGTVFLKNIDVAKKQAEFGIFIGEPKGRGKKLSYLATYSILRIAFEEIGLNRVYLSVVGDNIPAVKTYLRVGFCETGRELNTFPREDHFVDVIHMAISRESWEREQSGEDQSNCL